MGFMRVSVVAGGNRCDPMFGQERRDDDEGTDTLKMHRHTETEMSFSSKATMTFRHPFYSSFIKTHRCQKKEPASILHQIVTS